MALNKKEKANVLIKEYIESVADKLEKVVANLNDSTFKRECRRGTKLFQYICSQPKFQELVRKELH